METETFDIQKACEAQKKYVEGKGYPHFAPMSGRCYSCGRNIYQQFGEGNWKSGYSVERVSKELVTGCPHCHISYCE